MSVGLRGEKMMGYYERLSCVCIDWVKVIG